jgi:hypothetical protein
MDKKIAGLLGAAAALTAVNSAHSGANDRTGNGSKLPGPLGAHFDPLALLKDDDAQRTGASAVGGTRLAQHHHHHHHHHGVRREIRHLLPHRHHHHHHD